MDFSWRAVQVQGMKLTIIFLLCSSLSADLTWNKKEGVKANRRRIVGWINRCGITLIPTSSLIFDKWFYVCGSPVGLQPLCACFYIAQKYKSFDLTWIEQLLVSTCKTSCCANTLSPVTTIHQPFIVYQRKPLKYNSAWLCYDDCC